jgi:hypothetical protein
VEGVTVVTQVTAVLCTASLHFWKL